MTNHLTATAEREIRSARNLDELLRLLRRHLGNRPEGWTVTQREESLMSKLPTFGGDEPSLGSRTVWSWDEGRVIDGLCVDEMQISDRPRCAFEGCQREPISVGGLCPSHYQQQRRGRPLTPLGLPVEERVERARLTVRVDAATHERLRQDGAPATVAAEVLARWARG